jgi:hypothetical protein
VSGQLHAPAALPPGRSPQYTFLDRRPGGPQNRSARRGEEKIFAPTSAVWPAANWYPGPEIKISALKKLNYFYNKCTQMPVSLRGPKWNVDMCDKSCIVLFCCFLLQSAHLQGELHGPLLLRRPWMKCEMPKY